MFAKNRCTTDGLQAHCKDCNREKRESRRPVGGTLVVRTRYGRTESYFRGPNHGESRTALYKCWKNMRRRCSDPKTDAYQWYGGRGIKVCEAWEKDFLIFRDWAVAHGYEPGMQIDREDTDGDYTPENCRWTTRIQNLRNRRQFLPEELDQRLRRRAQQQGVSVYSLIRQAVAQYLESPAEEVRGSKVRG